MFAQAFIYLIAAVITVPLAHRLGLGSVLGYLLAGVAIGPWALGLVSEGGDVMHFAEFGVVMMLFLVGIELEPSRLWRLRVPVIGVGAPQVLASAAVVCGVGLLAGLPWQQSMALGLILAMSSTAIVLQTLTEKGLMKTEAGQTAFSVLLFQDIAVIGILAIFPLLVTLPIQEGGHTDALWIDGFPAWQRAIIVLAAVAAVVVLGRFAVRPLMRAVARTGMREMFTAAALLIVVGVDLLMVNVGLSAALGTFVAGVVLANSEYRHELVSDIEPFKGLLLGLFFIAVGASIDFGLLVAQPFTIAALVVAVMFAKTVALGGVARAWKMSRETSVLLALSLAQVGEFAFVLFSQAEQQGILPKTLTGPMVAVTAFSMAATPFVFTFHERVIAPRLRPSGAAQRASDVQDEHNAVIIAGFGRFGQIAGRFLRSNGIGTTVLDVDSDQVDTVRKFGQPAFYGDASRIDLLVAAGAHEAQILIVAVDEPEKVNEIVHAARKHFPNLAILARARGRTEAYELLEAGIEGVYRETFDASLRMGVDAMRLLGMPAYTASRSARMFRVLDEQAIRDMAQHRGDEATLISKSRERLRTVEQVLAKDRAGWAPTFGSDGSFDSEAIRKDIIEES